MRTSFFYCIALSIVFSAASIFIANIDYKAAFACLYGAIVFLILMVVFLYQSMIELGKSIKLPEHIDPSKQKQDPDNTELCRDDQRHLYFYSSGHEKCAKCGKSRYI